MTFTPDKCHNQDYCAVKAVASIHDQLGISVKAFYEPDPLVLSFTSLAKENNVRRVFYTRTCKQNETKNGTETHKNEFSKKVIQVSKTKQFTTA